MATLIAISFVLLHRGQTSFVIHGMLTAMFVVVMVPNILGEGIRDQNMMTLFIILTLASFFLGQRATFLLGGAAVVVTIIMYFLERANVLIHPENPIPLGVDDLIVPLLSIVNTIVILQLLLRQIVTSEAQALKAREQAEQANQAKSQFLANMSHELRTPLNGILGYTQILARRTDYSPQERQQALSIIEDSGSHLLTLINDILDLAKVEAGKLTLQENAVYLPEFLQTIVSMIEIRAQDKAIGFAFERVGAIPDIILADEVRLRQVLLNLLSNGVKFTQEGGVTFRITTQDSVAQTATLLFEVIDSGAGISSDKLEQIFRPFEQADEAHHQQMGTGLGLAISRQLIQAMGSTIQVESTVGEGSRFWFSLTVRTVAKSVTSGQSPKATTTIQGYEGSRRTILVVDDVERNRIVLRELLQPLGFGIVEAVDGQTAVHAVQSQQPDIILMDLVMPKVTGFEAIQKIREDARFDHIPIIAVSANVMEPSREQSLALGGQAFLPKPIQANALLAQLAHHLRLKWQYEEANKIVALQEKMIYPTGAELEVMLDLARIGDLTAVQHQARQLSQQNPQYAPFAAKISELTQTFADDELLELLQAAAT
ncbi:MAG: ATP-binding protein [Chloroflexota bacterium]